jgi:urea transporter
VRDQFVAVRRRVLHHFAAIGQTFFVENPWVGLASVGVLAVFSPTYAASGLAVSVFARLCAVRYGATQAFIDTGLVELNGWFLGLCCATFFAPGPGLIVALACAGPLVAAFAIIMRRVLATWDVPLMVGPYLPSFWLLWAALAAFAWADPVTLPTVTDHASSPIQLIVLGGLRGIGEIFFLPDARLGVGIAIAASLHDRRLGVMMVGSSIAAVAVGYFAGAPLWQVETGLAGFTPALVVAAALRGFVGLGPLTVALAVLASPFLEAGALRIGGSLGLPALSATYIGLVWGFALVRPVRDAGAARSAWSMAPAAAKRPRLFEDG